MSQHEKASPGDRELSLAAAIAYLNKHSGAGVWVDYDDRWISPDVNNGQRRKGIISKETLAALKAANVIGSNIYAGHKGYRRVYEVVPLAERATYVRDTKAHPWTLFRKCQARIGSR